VIEATILERARASARRCKIVSKSDVQRAGHDVVRQAEQRLQNAPYLALRSVRCECRDEALVLRGQVASFYLKQLAHQVVRSIQGVDLVVNDVQVRR